MIDHLENITIQLIINHTAPGLDALFIDIVDVNNGLPYNILRLEKGVQWLVITFVWVTILITSYFRHILYSYLLQQYKSKDFTRINGLILLTSVLEHATVIVLAVPYTIMVCVGTPLQLFAGLWLCYSTALFCRFVIIYSFVGGLGISLSLIHI